MDEIYPDSYFENIQLVKLVSSAEALLQHLYDSVSQEDKQFIDQWLCFKQEFDSCSRNKLDFNLERNDNLFDDQKISSDTELSELNNFSFDDDILRRDEDSCSSETLDSDEETASEEDPLTDEESEKNFSSGFESGSQNMLDKYSKSFQVYTDSLVSGWLSNLNLSTIEKPCSDFNSNQRKSIGRNGDHSNNSIPTSRKDIFSLRYCHCCANESVNCYSLLLSPLEEQISYLRMLKEPLIQACQKITNHVGKCDFSNKTDNELVTLQEVIDLLDMSMEMKNYERMVDLEMEKFMLSDHLVYSSILNCLKMLSSAELHYIFICFLNKAATLRENSSALDKLILQLDNTIVDKEIRLRYLNESYNKLRDTCASLRNKSKLLPANKSSNEKLEAVINAHRTSSLEKSSTDSSAISKEESSSNFLRNLSQRSFKALQGNTAKSFGVIRQGKKLIIQQNKNP